MVHALQELISNRIFRSETRRDFRVVAASEVGRDVALRPEYVSFEKGKVAALAPESTAVFRRFRVASATPD